MISAAGEENAGLVDIGDQQICAFKIESHNHPSAIEPYHGAATGVGGINRDIFTLGARPVAQLVSLRFGNPATNPDSVSRLMKGIVKGIGDYGNAFGLATVKSDVRFNDCYLNNPLMNAMSAGIVKRDAIVSSIAKGAGNPVYLAVSATGKDGIQGAIFASSILSGESDKDIPAVQVGDPLLEKLLMEASIEAAETGFLIGMQDLGAAGISCATSEMSARGEHGMEIHLDRIPLRQPDMQAFEILLSESQERMLMVVEKGREAEIEMIFNKWELNCVKIGEVTDDKQLRFYKNGEVIAEIAAWNLVMGGGAPVYEREYRKPAYIDQNDEFKEENIKVAENLKEAAEFLCAHPNISSKRWIYEQFDSTIGNGNLGIKNPSDAALIKLKKSFRVLALTVNCNESYVYSDPEKGAAIAIARAARDIVCSGGKPLAITNCLNFGNPYDQEVYWQFVQVIKGMKEACEKFRTPVTGGNVSFYNQYQQQDGSNTPVFPSPVIGMLGTLDKPGQQMSMNFKHEGDLIYLIGESKNDLASSEYLRSYCSVKHSAAPDFDYDSELKLQEAVFYLVRHKLVQSAHGVSEGGLFISLLESAMPGYFGFDISSDPTIRKDAFLFGESQSRAVVSVKPADQDMFIEASLGFDTEVSLLGEVSGKGNIMIDNAQFGNTVDLRNIYDHSIERLITD